MKTFFFNESFHLIEEEERSSYRIEEQIDSKNGNGHYYIYLYNKDGSSIINKGLSLGKIIIYFDWGKTVLSSVEFSDSNYNVRKLHVILGQKYKGSMSKLKYDNDPDIPPILKEIYATFMKVSNEYSSIEEYDLIYGLYFIDNQIVLKHYYDSSSSIDRILIMIKNMEDDFYKCQEIINDFLNAYIRIECNLSDSKKKTFWDAFSQANHLLAKERIRFYNEIGRNVERFFDERLGETEKEERSDDDIKKLKDRENEITEITEFYVKYRDKMDKDYRDRADKKCLAIKK